MAEEPILEVWDHDDLIFRPRGDVWMLFLREGGALWMGEDVMLVVFRPSFDQVVLLAWRKDDELERVRSIFVLEPLGQGEI